VEPICQLLGEKRKEKEGMMLLRDILRDSHFKMSKAIPGMLLSHLFPKTVSFFLLSGWL
jgi:hypothetical protein